jgi:hypothetical protein
MDKFFSNLGKGGKNDAKKNDAKKKDEEEKRAEKWQGGFGELKSETDKQQKSSGGGGGGKNTDGKSKNGSNVFTNAGASIKDALGKIDLSNHNKSKIPSKGGQSLGGSRPGLVLSICLDQPGPLGIQVEKSKSNQAFAVVSACVPKSQAERAGLKLGDIVCYSGTNGEREIPYDKFVASAKSGSRPLKFDVRRIESSVLSGGGGGGGSADAFARKQAMIAAAEARDAKHKATQKAIPKTEKRTFTVDPSADTIYEYDGTNETEETRRAVAAAKQSEKKNAERLGYNPYETNKMTSVQARTAAMAAAYGDINAGNANGVGETPSPGRVNKPSDPTTTTPPEFDHAFSILVTSNADHAAVLNSSSIMRKLINNAITKGQQGDEEASSKFRRVRLSNPKIKEAITDVQGALELMLCVGFVLSENIEDSETYLVYPPGEKGASWLGDAMAVMQSYENGGITTEKI